VIPNAIFQAARHADNVWRSVHVERDMPQMSGSPRRSLQQPAIDDYATAHSSPQGEHHGVRYTVGRADPHFSHRGRVSIVQHQNVAI
jgi:hypothetical protein